MTWLKAGFQGIIQWAGETLIGLIPLAAYEITRNFSAPTAKLMSCPLSETVYLSACSPLVESASQEMCILTVVISGLSLLSIARIGFDGNHAQITTFTRLLMIFAIASLVAGALLYAFYSAHIDHSANNFTISVLAMALVSSFFISLERAILEA
ncbi:MAG: hypothetical protein ACYC5H_12205 [Methylovirgula sp.]